MGKNNGSLKEEDEAENDGNSMMKLDENNEEANLPTETEGFIREHT